jgi:hypothetical protein
LDAGTERILPTPGSKSLKSNPPADRICFLSAAGSGLSSDNRRLE